VTACVWVGYADTTTPMTTEFAGGPVDGGTFPALIWASVISAWEEIQAQRAAESGSDEDEESEDSGSYETPSPSYSAPAPESAAPEEAPSAPESAPAPEAEAAPAPAPAPAPESSGGVSGGTGGAAAPG
jgi:hypothetical protein